MSDFRAISGVTKSLGAFLKAQTGVEVENQKAPSDTIPGFQSADPPVSVPGGVEPVFYQL